MPTTRFARRCPVIAGLIVGLLAPAPPLSKAAPYQDAVNALNPSFYYQLNETTTAGGCVDSTGHAAPGTYNGNYVNGPAMVGGPGPLEVFGGIPVPGVGGVANLAHYSNNEGHILLGPNTAYGANSITVAFFFKAGGPQGGDRIFTNNLTDPTKSFQINTANEGLVMSVDPNIEGGPDTERTLFREDNSTWDLRLSDAASGWFHIVASTHGDTGPERAGNYKLWVNGVDRTANLVARTTGWGVNTEFAKIGGREPDPLHTTTHPGAQDEVAIWLNRVLTDAEAMSLWTAATTVPGQTPPFVMTSSRNAANGDITLKFPSVDGAVYAVDRSPDLSNWSALTSNLQGTGSELTFVDDSDEGHAARRFYYRARKLP